ncbi:heme-binding protein [Novosphingobium sp. Chol11]|uniref:SOUL family heme-binding protein n=1 Tax=Novosphingobium sp. Chol11 TaxID=1385763 RepID=UPI0025FBA008|nr:heme-binding protein [Novosphingobium sp. Chol11]
MIKRLLLALAVALALVLGLTVTGVFTMATEEPPFTVAMVEGAFELRDYPALIAAEVSVGGQRRDAASKGFRLLAGYIFGGNTRKQRIAVTAPVTQAPAGGEKIAMTAPVLLSGGGPWTIRFIMPRGSALETLPTPNNPAVKLRELAPARMAVIRFSGLAGQANVDAKTQELAGFIKAQNLAATGPAALAQYDPPWTLWFLRRNEVMIPVAGASAP